MRVIIIGGMAAGASAAARLRRLNEFVEITLIEKGPVIAYASYGMPYYISRVIPSRNDLLMTDAEVFRKRFNVDVRTNCEAIDISRTARVITIRNVDGSTEELPYNRLLLATGSVPVRISIPGLPKDRALTLHSLSDLDILDAVCRVTKSALVLGGCQMGIEIAENLAKRGLSVTLVEKGRQFFPEMLDPEMAIDLPNALREVGINVRTRRTVVAWADGIAKLDNSTTVPADFIIMAVGIRPNSALAQAASLELGPRRHIKVNKNLATSDPAIFAAGDVAVIEGECSAFADSAYMQGHFIAAELLGERNTQGFCLDQARSRTSIARVGDLTVASVGETEHTADEYVNATYIHPKSHMSCCSSVKPLHIKILYKKEYPTEIVGAQVVGHGNVAWIIRQLSKAIQNDFLPFDSQITECYQTLSYCSSHAPLNSLSMILDNFNTSLSCAITPTQIPKDAFLLDVREPAEVAAGTIPGAINIPLGELRDHLDELPRICPIVTFSAGGKRGYFAERIIKQRLCESANVYYLAGGYVTWLAFKKARLI